MIDLQRPLEGVPGLLLMAALIFFGATIGIGVALVFTWIPMSDALANFLGGVVGAGLGAALAVMGAVYVQRDDRRREEKAAMAVLPLALSSLTQYTERCIQFLDAWIGPNAAHLHFSNDLEAPVIPNGTIGPLQASARFAEPEDQEKISKALGKLQIQHSRISSWALEHRGQRITPLRRHEGYGYMVDTAELHAAIVALFKYSRDEALVRERASLQEMTNALHNSGIWDDGHSVWERVEARDLPAATRR